MDTELDSHIVVVQSRVRLPNERAAMTDRNDAVIYGQCDPWPTREEMVSLFNAAGIRAHVGVYSVRLHEHCGISFECYGGDLGEPQVESKPASVDELVGAATMVSQALAAAGVRHHFEIFNAEEKLAGYVHHNWPSA